VRKLIVLAALAASLLLPALASASWDGGVCNQSEGGHCYVLEGWKMSGVEKIEGASEYIETKDMNVGGWASGAFVDNEMWLGFNSEPEKYTEVGQTSGGNHFILEPENEPFERNCCALHAFWSYAISKNNWYDYAAPWAEPPNTWNLYQISGQSHNGTWCDYFTSTQAWCKSGYPSWATDIEVGAELVANSEPENWARSAVNAWWGGTTHNWLKSTPEAEPHLCYNRSEYHGNFEWWTCP
jgi:hypothetical protein